MRKKVTLWIILVSLFAAGTVVFFVWRSFADEITVPVTQDFGVVTFVNSLPSRANKFSTIEKTEKAGFTWAREEYVYTEPMNFVPFDSAYNKITGDSNLKILGLLTYPGDGRDLEIWRQYVTQVTTRYPKIQAWEIMNEIDNHLTATEYVPYLQAAYQIIKSQGNAHVICSGLTGRQEAFDFWTELKAAGGWDYCDGLGLHPYHTGDPLVDDGNGTLADLIQRSVDTIKKIEGDLVASAVPSKKIWVTEFGYDSMKVSDENQTKWLIEGMSIMHSFPEIEKIFVYRLYENDDGYGLVAPNYDEKLAFSAISNWLLSPSSLRPTAEISQERSSVQIQGALAVANGTDQFNIVVDVKDKDGKPVIDKKPSITVTGGQIRLSDFESKDGKWVAKVSSFEAGQKTAEIKVDKQVLGTANVFFSDTKQESVTQPRPQVSLPVVATSTPIIASVTPTIQSIPTNANTPSPKTATESSSTKTGLFWFLTIEIPIIAMIIIVLWIINKRRQAY